MYKRVRGEDLALGDDVTVWFMPDGNSGQGGILAENGESGWIRLRLPNGETQSWGLTAVHHFSVDKPGAPEECLQFNSGKCEGPVEMWHSGGMNGRSWPRCTYHGEKRLNSRSELERYADSDCPPPGFREDDIGERWDDD